MRRLLLTAAVLAACGGGGGAPSAESPDGFAAGWSRELCDTFHLADICGCGPGPGQPIAECQDDYRARMQACLAAAGVTPERWPSYESQAQGCLDALHEVGCDDVVASDTSCSVAPGTWAAVSEACELPFLEASCLF